MEYVRGTVVSIPHTSWDLLHNGNYVCRTRYAKDYWDALRRAKLVIQEKIKTDPVIYKSNDRWELRTIQSD